MLDPLQWDFAAARRTATLVTCSGRGDPRPIPICFVLEPSRPGEDTTRLYSPLDEKPKRSADVRALARVRDITERPDVTLLFERWSEDWTELAWVRARGTASLMEPTADPDVHRWAVDALRAKYPQYRSHRLERSPLIRIEIDHAVAWSAADHPA